MEKERGPVQYRCAPLLMCLALCAAPALVQAKVQASPADTQTRQAWEGSRLTSAPAARSIDRFDYSGRGVRLGVLDQGFNAGMWGDSDQALASSLKELINPAVTNAGDHGAVVSRVVAGRYIGDTFEQGLAHGSQLYVANLDHSLLDMYPRFHQRGVNIINNSWVIAQTYDEWLSSLHDRDALDQVALFATWQHRAVMDHGQLLVWAAGNDSLPDPAWPPTAPSIYPELQKGWLTVVWLDDDNSLHADSNACGLSANWCISSLSGHAQIGGTSLAAPVVTATAGLVSEAFPWMDNSALRQTLLSTADSLGDPALYGWGKINPDRAVRGPARFDTALTFDHYFRATFDGYRSEFFNDISGDSGLVKDGNGTLVLWGNNTYQGHTYIDGGTLELYGSVAQDLVNTKAGTLITNGGRIGGNFYNDNITQVGGAGLHIKENLITGEGLLRVQFGSSITVGRGAFIQGGQLEVTGLAPLAVVAKRATVIRAESVVGRLSSVSGGGLLQTVTPIYLEDRVDVEVQRHSASVVVNQHFEGARAKHSAADAIDVSLTSAERAFDTEPSRASPPIRERVVVTTTPVNEALPPSDDSQEPRASIPVSDAFVEKMAALHSVASVQALGTALDSLTGEIHASSQALSFQQAQTINRALSNRVDALSGAGQASGLWVSMLNADGKLQQAGYARGDTHVMGAQWGGDHRLSHESVIGMALSWSHGKAAFEDLGGNAKGQSLGVSLYGRYGASTGNYLAGRIGHERIHSNVSRSIVIDRPERVDSNRRDAMTSLYAEIGHVLDTANATYAPFVGAEFNRLRRGCFEETGSALALRAGGATYDQAAASLGMHYQSAPFQWAAGDTSVTVSGAYRYSNARDLNFEASFTGAPDATFKLKGIGLPRHSGWLGLGVATAPGASNMNWYVNVDVQFARHGLNNNAVSAGLRYDFG